MDTVSAVSHSASDSSLTTSVANVLVVSFGVLFSLITKANLCYCIYYLQCKDVMAEYSGLCSSTDLSPLFNLEQLSFLLVGKQNKTKQNFPISILPEALKALSYSPG